MPFNSDDWNQLKLLIYSNFSVVELCEIVSEGSNSPSFDNPEWKLQINTNKNSYWSKKFDLNSPNEKIKPLVFDILRIKSRFKT